MWGSNTDKNTSIHIMGVSRGRGGDMGSRRLKRMKAKTVKLDEARNPHVLVEFCQLDMNLDIARKKDP